MLFLIYCVAIWSLAPWPFNFWLFVIGAATDDRCREPFKDALYWNPEVVSEIARRKIESAEASRGRVTNYSSTSARPRRHG